MNHLQWLQGAGEGENRESLPNWHTVSAGDDEGVLEMNGGDVTQAFERT